MSQFTSTTPKPADKMSATNCKAEDGFTTPKSVDGFSRKALDEAFGKSTSSKGFTKHGKKTNDAVTSSPAVKAGLVKTCLDGSVDQRSAAVKQGLVVVDESGEVVKNESLLCQEQVAFTDGGKVSKTSTAVKSDLVRLTKDGKVDKRCAAVRRDWLVVDEDGQVNEAESALCQRLYLKETNGAHIHGFEVADTITKLSGLQYTEEEVVRMTTAINSNGNVRIKTRLGNMSGAVTAPQGSGDLTIDGVITCALEDVMNGKSVQLSMNVAKRAKRIAKDILSGDYPVEYKEGARKLFTEMTDEEGHKIIRSNAKITTPEGVKSYHVSLKPKSVATNLSSAFEDAATDHSTLPSNERAAREVERAQREEAKCVEQREAERLQKEEAKRAEQQREAERLQKEEAKRVEQQKEAERKQREAAKRAEQQKEAERKQREEARRQREEAERAEQQKRQKEEAQRRQKEEINERQRREEAQRAEQLRRQREESERGERLRREEAQRAEQMREAERRQRERAAEQARYAQQQARATLYASPSWGHQPFQMNYGYPQSHFPGSFSGSYHVSRGSANGSALFTGPRGGTYYINSNGNRTYV